MGSTSLVTRAAWATHSPSTQGGLALYTPVPLDPHGRSSHHLHFTVHEIEFPQSSVIWPLSHSRQKAEQEFQPGSGTHQTAEVPGVRAPWTIQHSYLHTCPLGHTHSDKQAHTEPILPGNSARAWPAAVLPLVPAALLRLAMPAHPPLPLENRRKRS